ncbi:uncharacterized protein LOC142544283 [Primulina tabacum]|uniref:uncharacterized protein LOC142544283 n=1 Tax=Primulina tabacum TaxID=48773 RepID=UPI003F598180
MVKFETCYGNCLHGRAPFNYFQNICVLCPNIIREQLWSGSISEPTIEMSKTLNYVFWAFRPCVDEFRHCQKIISFEGTHLYTKYKQKMFIGVTLDANNQVLPLAFAIVGEETSDSWKWFLENLGRHVVRGENGVCHISDRHKGIVRATEDLPYFQSPYGVHRFCLRHVCSNFNAKFKDVHLKDLCWATGTQNQICKFYAIMEAIKQKTLWRTDIWLELRKKNGVWLMAKVGVVRKIQLWSDYACRKYEKSARKSSEHRVAKYDVREQTASVATVGRPSRGQHMQVVKLSTSDCSCDKWTIFGIPLSHAICTAKWHSLDPATLVQPCYNISEYLATYEGRFQPLADERYWDPPNFELHHNPVRRERRRVGRDRTTRLRNEIDTAVFRERQHR